MTTCALNQVILEYLGPKMPTFLGTAAVNAATAVVTFTGRAIGTASADRRVHVAAHLHDDASGDTISSITVDGFTATINVQAATGAQAVCVGIATVLVPSQSTVATIVVTASGAQTFGIGVGWYVSYGLASNNAIAVATSIADPGVATVATVAGSFAIAASSVNAAETVSWSNVTERYDFFLTGASLGISGAMASGLATGSINPSADFSGADTRRMTVAASF